MVATVKCAIQAVMVRPEFRRVAIRFYHQGLSQGWFDPRGLEQVITNVVLNACEAVSPGTGQIEVRAWGRHERFEISIADNGPGIPLSIRHALFQPYVTYGKKRGTGLGLAIAQKILRDHGGDICLKSTGENGTEFRLILPSRPPGHDHLKPV
jgi:signal transduction histidine kinase